MLSDSLNSAVRVDGPLIAEGRISRRHCVQETSLGLSSVRAKVRCDVGDIRDGHVLRKVVWRSVAEKSRRLTIIADLRRPRCWVERDGAWGSESCAKESKRNKAEEHLVY